MVGGADAVQGLGEDYLFTCGTAYNLRSFNLGDKVTLQFTDQSTGYQTQVGAGYVTGAQFNFILTYSNKVYGLAGSRVYCSAVGYPTQWNDPNAAGNGYVELSNYYAATQKLYAAVPFQGKMAFFGRDCVQIWQIAPDINNWQITQILQNIGTIAGETAQGLGELDVIFLAETGFRALRQHAITLNAMQNDIGSAIDTLVQPTYAGLTDAQKQSCCAIVEPTTGRYWCFVPSAFDNTGKVTAGNIYVLSYYPQNKIIAWSRYNPTDSTGAFFAPKAFAVFNGQVYVTDGSNIYAYGGANGTTYDSTAATITIPFFDEKRPGHKKMAKAIDVDVTGSWDLSASPDWIGMAFHDIATIGKATFDNGWYNYYDSGTHFAVQLVNNDANPGSVASILFHYELAEEP